MRSTHRCPKCSGQRFVVTDEFRVPEQESANTTRAFPAVAIDTKANSSDPRGPWQREMLGAFTTWICLGCGYTEFYAHHLDGVNALAQQYPHRLRIVDAGPPKQGPVC